MAQHAGLSRVLGEVRERSGWGGRFCRGFLVTGWGTGLQRTLKVPPGEKESALHICWAQ